ncbi:MAG: hypothetical protein JXR51_15590, partial [Bacteroidales bacterium]|nr:hypothetical protein [Bacteroidales bacterium]
MKKILFLFALLFSFANMACNQPIAQNTDETTDTISELKMKLNEFESVKLTTDLTELSDNEKEMLPFLFEAAKIMDDIYWIEAFGDKKDFLKSLDADNKDFA